MAKLILEDFLAPRIKAAAAAICEVVCHVIKKRQAERSSLELGDELLMSALLLLHLSNLRSLPQGRAFPSVSV